MNTRESDYVSLFEQCLTDCLQEDGEFNANLFFRKWFHELGESYYFVFRENLSRTNIQFAELFALIRAHFHALDGPLPCLQFRDRTAVLEGLKATITHLASSIGAPKDVAHYIARLYGPSLRTGVIVEPFYGSCSIFLPPHIKVDLPVVCAESGFIHSCGVNIHTRELGIATESKLFDDLRGYLDAHRFQEPTLFVVFCHEDFTRYDATHAYPVPGSFTDLRLYIEKIFLGQKPLVDVLQAMRNRFSSELVVPPPGDYREEHQELRHNGRVDLTHTLCLVVDSSIARENFRHKGPDRYLICYDQRFANDNPFFYFDENKPGWLSHTTMPHTLTAAMINITQPGWPEGTVRIGDVFAGAGTTWLEAGKCRNAKVICSDIHLLSQLATRDNAEFFAMNDKQLDELLTLFSGIENAPIQPPPLYESETRARQRMQYDDALLLFAQYLDSQTAEPGAQRLGEILMSLEGKSFECRLLFYLLLKTELRHHAGLTRDAREWGAFFQKEVGLLRDQVTTLLHLRRHSEEIPHDCEQCYSIRVGQYSNNCTISTAQLRQIARCDESQGVVSIRDATAKRTRADAGCLDVVITDPPYGFNTNEEARELSWVYTRSIRNMLGMLNKGGQLVLSVPERSHSGRIVAAFTNKRWVTQQILAEAERQDLEAIVPARVVPQPGKLFRPPFYWESEKALGRWILHFAFRRRSSESTGKDDSQHERENV